MEKIIRNVKLEGLRLRLIDAKGEVVGRLASQLSRILQGKDKPTYAPNRDGGDICVVLNTRQIDFTGRKWDNKLYRWHTGYPGGLKERTAQQVFDKKPEQILRAAVSGMLPKNTLRKARMRKLRLFLDDKHPFAASDLVPWEMPPRKLRDKGIGWSLPEGFEPMNPDAYLKRLKTSKLASKMEGKAAVWDLDNQQKGGVESS